MNKAGIYNIIAVIGALFDLKYLSEAQPAKNAPINCLIVFISKRGDVMNPVSVSKQ